MSFASEAKAELCRMNRRKKCCAVAEAYGVVLYCNSFSKIISPGLRVAAIACTEPTLMRKLVIGKQSFEEVEKRFHAMGFDRAFPPGTDPQVTIQALHELLDEKE